MFRALGDATRYAIYCEVAGAPSPRSTAEVAAALGLHPNTVRPHLERLRQVGLLDVGAESRGTVGRPQHRYQPTADAPSLGLEHPAMPVLAELLAEVADTGNPGAGELAERVGRQWGQREGMDGRREATGGVTGEDGGEAGATAPAGSGGTTPIQDCVAALTGELAGLGFDPAVTWAGTSVTVSFTRCPYRELAEAHPDLVCRLHRGLVEGMVEAVGGAAVGCFATLADRDPCRVQLGVR